MFIFYTPKYPNIRILSSQKKSIPPSIPLNLSVLLHWQILIFIFWKAKTCQLQLWFWSKTKLKKKSHKYPLIYHSGSKLCFCWFETMKNTMPNFFFRDPNNSRIFHRPKKSFWSKFLTPKKSFGPPPPSLKIYEWFPPRMAKQCKEQSWTQITSILSDLNLLGGICACYNCSSEKHLSDNFPLFQLLFNVFSFRVFYLVVLYLSFTLEVQSSYKYLSSHVIWLFIAEEVKHILSALSSSHSSHFFIELYSLLDGFKSYDWTNDTFHDFLYAVAFIRLVKRTDTATHTVKYYTNKVHLL